MPHGRSACEQDGDAAASGQWAQRAVALFRAQGRPRWQLLARYSVLRAEAAGERPAVAVARRLVAIAESLRRAGWGAQAEEAEVRAAEVLVGARKLAEATDILGRLAPGVHRMLPLNRLQFRLCQARLRWAAGDARGAERALEAGLRALLAYQATLGSMSSAPPAGGRRRKSCRSAWPWPRPPSGRPGRCGGWKQFALRSSPILPPARRTPRWTPL